MTTNFLNELEKEIHPSTKDRMKHILRPIYSKFRRSLGKRKILKYYQIPSDWGMTDFFVNEGGYTNEGFLKHANRLFRLNNKTLLIIGCGYGRHLYTIAKKFHPKAMYCIDPYASHKEWNFLKNKIESKTNVKLHFYTATLEEAIDKIPLCSIDCCLSDAVLEHVQNMDHFLSVAHQLLKEDGSFYASFGPLWYSPGGDHHEWGYGHEYDHLILSPQDYQKKWDEYNQSHQQEDYSTESFFMCQKKLFSYLKPKEYINFIRKYFTMKDLWIGFRDIALTKKAENDSVYCRLANKMGDELPLAIRSMFVFCHKRPLDKNTKL